MTHTPRIAARGILLHENRLLLVNAYRGRTDLWCAPGGGVNIHESLPDAITREMQEECGLTVAVHTACLVNEFHDPNGDFHQIDIYFRCTLLAGDPTGDWTDPEGIVTHRRWTSRGDMAGLRVKPDSLAAVAWSDPDHPTYDPLEPILR